MTLQQIILLALQISIALIVFSLGLRTRTGDIASLFRNPSLLVRSVLAMNVVMPVVAATIAALFHLRPQVKVALVVLAVSPVPPILPGKQTKAGGNVSYAVGLSAASAVVSLFAVPASMALLGRLFGHEVSVPMRVVAAIVAKTVLAPLALGLVVGRVVPTLAERMAGPISSVAMIALLLGLIPILAKLFPAIVAQMGDFTIVAIVIFTVIGLVVGHALGGPAPEDRTVLALATACRHPGVAITIAGALAMDPQARGAVAATVFLCVLVGAIVAAPYVKSRRRSRAPGVTPAATPVG